MLFWEMRHCALTEFGHGFECAAGSVLSFKYQFTHKSLDIIKALSLLLYTEVVDCSSHCFFVTCNEIRENALKERIIGSSDCREFSKGH